MGGLGIFFKSGVPDLKEGDAVRIELRWYRAEVGEENPNKIFVVTKRLVK